MDAEAEPQSLVERVGDMQVRYVPARSLRYLYRVHPADENSTLHWEPYQRHFGKIYSVCDELKKDLVADVSPNCGPISFFFKTEGKADRCTASYR